MHHQIEDAGLGNLRIVDLDLVGLREKERRRRHEDDDKSGAKSLSDRHVITLLPAASTGRAARRFSEFDVRIFVELQRTTLARGREFSWSAAFTCACGTDRTAFGRYGASGFIFGVAGGTSFCAPECVKGCLMAIECNPFLPRYKRKPLTQFQQEGLQVIDQSLFQR